MSWLRRNSPGTAKPRGDDRLARILASTGDLRIAVLAAETHDLAAAIDASADEEALRGLRVRALRGGDVWWAHLASRRRRALGSGPDAHAEAIADLVALGLTDAARAEADLVPQEAAGDSDVRNALAHLLIREGRLDEALEIAEDLPTGQDGKYALIWTGIAEAAFARGQQAMGAEVARRAVEFFPGLAATRATQMRALYLRGEADAALALAAQPWPDAERKDEPAVIEREVEIMVETGQLHRAVNRAMAALEQRPRLWALYYICFEATALTGRTDEYDAAVRRLAKMPVDDPQMAGILAIRAADTGDTAGLARLLDQLRAMSPPLYLHTALGVALAEPTRPRDDIDAAHRACVAAAFPHDAADIQLASHIYFVDSGDDGFRRALGLIEPLLERHLASPAVLLLHLRLLIALGRDDDARKVLDAAPAGLKGGLRLEPMKLYFLARDGRDREARAGWRRRMATCREPAANANGSYPEAVHLKWRDTPDAILLFCVIFNGIQYVDWLLEHYRVLGVDHFFFVDNRSTDGTLERLAEQRDVSLFRARGSFAASCCGVLWNNHLIRRFGTGHWCLHVDMDEALVFPGMEDGRDLRELTRYLDAQRYGATRSMMVDIYPDSLTVGQVADPFAESIWIDRDYTRFPIEFPPYEGAHGGVRTRLQNRNVMLTKSPILKVDDDTWYLTTNHTHTHVPIADLSTALLHYKFVGDMRARVDEAISRGEHFLDAIHYRSLKAGLDTAGDQLRGPKSVRYTGPQQLVELGLIDDSALWRSRRW